MNTGKRVITRKKMGFTNKMCIGIMGIILITILMGFYLAIKSIDSQYLGTLACFTVAIAPVDSVLGVVLREAIKKSTAENTGADGEGIVFAVARQNNFVDTTTDSPAI